MTTSQLSADTTIAPGVAPRSATSRLLPQHLADLRRSGLRDETIAAAGFWSETDPEAIARYLRWDKPGAARFAKQLGPCLAIPFRHSDGKLDGYVRLRPDYPRPNAGKYESPVGGGNLAYCTPGAIAVIDRNVEMLRQYMKVLAISEGEKKCIACDQADIPCIGLTGVWNWQLARKREEGKATGLRKLINDLAAIDWAGLIVPIIFDSDPTRNPSVNHARAELARVLTEHRADVRFVELPHGPIGADGLPGKMGLDDFTVAYGEEALRRLVQAAVEPPKQSCSLTEYRAQLRQARLDTVGSPGIYLDLSPTGSGKSYADIPAIHKAETSLTVLPSHDGCKETVETYRQAGLLAYAYPELNKQTCQNHALAIQAIEAGLSASGAVCLGCPYCTACDYRDAMAEADTAANRIATHRRAALGFATIAEGRRYIAIHEDAASVLRPMVEVHGGFEQVGMVVRAAGAIAWDAQDQDARYYFFKAEESANELSRAMATASETTSLALPPPVNNPLRADAMLFQAMRQAGVYPDGDAMRVCRAVAGGDVESLSVREDTIKGPKGASESRRSIVAVWRPTLPRRATIWISDATATADEISGLAGQPVIDKTPAGTIERRQSIIQVPADVKKSTATRRMLATLRAILVAIVPQKYHRIGVVCDKRHAPAIRGTAKTGSNLEPELRNRITKVEHYRSGHSRGSNTWLDECDLMIVLGTPRVPPTAIKNRLIQAGKVAAAARDGKWDSDWWSAQTPTGQRRTVRTLAYRDRDWYAAHHAIVNAELQQSIGRARAILENGIPAVVASCEPLGVPVLAEDFEPMSETEFHVLQTVEKLTDTFSKGACELTEQNSKGASSNELTEQNSKYIYLENTSVSTADVTGALNVSGRWVRQQLESLATRNLIKRVGRRGGWISTNPTDQPAHHSEGTGPGTTSTLACNAARNLLPPVGTNNRD